MTVEAAAVSGLLYLSATIERAALGDLVTPEAALLEKVAGSLAGMLPVSEGGGAVKALASWLNRERRPRKKRGSVGC